jgi:hypothetical protein
MARVLVTGMSGAGKTTLLDELRWRGHVTVDTDYDGRQLPRGTLRFHPRTPGQRADIARYKATVEPLLRRGATIELDGRRPVSELADAIEDLLGRTH